MLRSLGLSPEVVHRATAHEAAYQTTLRTSLRNPDETKLREIAGPETKMRKKIPGILKSLAKYGWFP
jgi:hypothetical protein